MKPIPISAAKDIATTYGYDQVIVIARKVGEGGGEHCTTYGKDKANCDVAARCGDFLKYKVMGWHSQETGSEHGPASEQRGEVVAAEAPNAAAAKAVQPDGPAIDVVSAIHRHAKELARLTETWPADSAPPPPDVQGWQPIETAPRDTPILLSIFASGDPERERLVVVGGSSDGVTWIDHYDYEIHPPTHWMPLPAPPQAKEGGL